MVNSEFSNARELWRKRDSCNYLRPWQTQPRSQGPRNEVVANEDTLLIIMFLGSKNWETFVADTTCLNKIRNTFCVPDTKLVSARNAARAGKRGNICVGNHACVRNKAS